VKLLVGRIDLSNRPSTRSFTRSRSRHAAHPLTCPSAKLAKAQSLSVLDPARLPARRVREVVVVRRPSVLVRPLSMDEGRTLQRITRSAKNPVRCVRSLRRIHRLPGGRPGSGGQPVASATQTPSQGSICTPYSAARGLRA
jgi:hypothetical protein